MNLRSASTGAAVAGTTYAVLWSSGFVGTAVGTRSAAAFDLLMWRYLVAVPLLVAACLLLRVRAPRRVLATQALLGLLVQVGYLGAVTLAVAHGVSAGTTALVAALQPMVVAVVAGPLLGERVRRVGWLGLLVGLVGVCLVVAGDLGAGAASWWLVAPVVAVLSLSAGTVLGRRWEQPTSVLLSIAVQTTVAGVVFTAAALVSGTASTSHRADFWLAVAWLVVLATFGGYGSYLVVLRRQGATRASTWLYLSPPVTMVWAWLVLGDAVGPLGLAGLGVAAGGVGLVLRGSPPGWTHVRPTGEACSAQDASASAAVRGSRPRSVASSGSVPAK